MMNDPVRIRQALRSASYEEALAERLGMNVTDLRSLQLVLDEPGMTPGLMAERSGLTTGAVTGVLDRLERAGLRPRTSDPTTAAARSSSRPRRRRMRAPRSTGIDEIDRRACWRLPGRSTGGDRRLPCGDCARPSIARPTSCAPSVRGGFVGRAYRAPLADATRGRLLFASGAPRLSLNIVAARARGPPRG